MSVTGWWIVGVVVAIAAIAVFVGKLIRKGGREYDGIMVAHDRERGDDPAVQWCCYRGSSPEDAVWRITELGETGRRLTLLRARSEDAKVARRGVVWGEWEHVSNNDAEADGAA